MGWDIVRRESNQGGGAKKREHPPAAPGHTPPNNRLQPTPSSLRSYVASASGRG